jgi:sulfur-carrier protein
MSITVQIPTALRRHTAGTASLTCAATNLGELFSVLDEKFPELKPHLRDDAGQVRRFLNIYVNEEDIRFLGGPTYAFQEGDEVLLVPSIAGGTNVAGCIRSAEAAMHAVIRPADPGR